MAALDRAGNRAIAAKHAGASAIYPGRFAGTVPGICTLFPQPDRAAMTADSSQLSPNRILIIKPSSIGDIVHALPVLPRLRRRWPQAKISWLVTPWYADLLRDHPLLDEVILFERKRLGRMWYKTSAITD